MNELFKLLSIRHSRTMLQSIMNYFGYGGSVSSLNSSRSYTTANHPLRNSETFHPRLNAIVSQLDMIAPRFILNKGDVQILKQPTEFYTNLKEKISKAEKRVFLSSLYLGKSQDELISCLSEALRSKPDLQVFILTDALRGTREAPQKCSASLLVSLVEEFGNRVDVRMYHTPHLNGLRKSVIPRRINEGWGLQHMKLYGFDDEIIMSGANLSSDYFTNRQDRYYIFKSKALTDYYFNIQKAINSLSYKIQTSKSKNNFRLSWPTSNASCEPHLNIERFISDSSRLLEPLLKQHSISTFEELKNNDATTIVYPVSQFTPLLNPKNDMSTEKPAILRLLAYLDSPSIKWTFTAGYFNMLPEIKERLLNGTASGNVITAAPEANGFYKSPGVSYYLPEAYLYFARQFLEEVKSRGKDAYIFVNEWKNGVVNTPNGWSYHSKGLWITVPNEENPSVTIIGSSNYTKRAYSLDLESNAIVITKDEDLKRDMADEINNLMKYTKKIELKDFEGENRKISYGVTLATKVLGGKL